MKSILLFFVLCVGAYTPHAQNTVTVKAVLKGLSPGLWVYYYPLVASERMDSVETVQDGFTIAVSVPEGEGDAYVFRVGKKYVENSLLFIYLDKEPVTLRGEGPLFKDVKLSGGESVRDYTAYTDYIKASPQLAGREALTKKANDLYQKKDTLGYTALRPELERMDSIDKALTEQWVLLHPSSSISAFILSFYLGRLPLDKKAAILEKLSPAARENAPAKRIEHSIRVDRLTGIGQTALDFTQDDTAGKPVRLKDFRGKYVLVDFWASWCVPCRGENPHVVAAYNKYKDKNFTVISVSLDRPGDKDKWLRAIHQDQLTWTNVSDLEYWNNAVAKQYDIQSIPSNLLLDPDGKIIAKDLHGDELEKKLNEIGATVQHTFTLKGTIEGQSTGWIRMTYAGPDGKRISDSSRITNGTFLFQGTIGDPTMAFLSGVLKSNSMDDPNYTDFFIESGAMTLALKKDHFKDAVLTGSPTQEEYKSLEAAKTPIIQAEQPLSKAFGEANEAYMKAVKSKMDDVTLDTLKYRAARLHDQFEPYSEQMAQIDYAFFRAHPQSYVTAFMLRFHTSALPLDTLQLYYDRLGTTVQQSSFGKEVGEELVQLRSGSPGSVAKDFTARDINGSPLTLSSFQGKYVLLDFWASWCVPCRQSMPHVKELYDRYKDKGLTVIGVSDDDNDTAAWKKAVAKDGTGIWNNVLRGLDWAKLRQGQKSANDISDKFGIHSLPTKILIDPKGVIIGRYDQGTDAEAAALDKKLAEAFGS